MSAEHTPGRWHANIHDGGQYFANITADLGKRDDGVGLICTIAVVLKYAQPSEREANARLIAAAPDMLAALIETLPQAEGCFANHYGDNPEGGAEPKHITMIRAAIAKAMGAA